MDGPAREMSLEECVEHLHTEHRARKELVALQEKVEQLQTAHIWVCRACNEAFPWSSLKSNGLVPTCPRCDALLNTKYNEDMLGLVREAVALQKDTERLTRINTWLKDPEGCHAAHPGETGYHCDANAPCVPCRLRQAEATLEKMADEIAAARKAVGVTSYPQTRNGVLEEFRCIAMPEKVVEPKKAKKGTADRWRDAGNNVGEPWQSCRVSTRSER